MRLRSTVATATAATFGRGLSTALCRTRVRRGRSRRFVRLLRRRGRLIRQLQCGQTGASAWIAIRSYRRCDAPRRQRFQTPCSYALANFACRHTRFVRTRRGWWRCLIALARQIPWSPNWNHQFRLQLPRPPASIRSLAGARSLRSKFFWC